MTTEYALGSVLPSCPLWCGGHAEVLEPDHVSHVLELVAVDGLRVSLHLDLTTSGDEWVTDGPTLLVEGVDGRAVVPASLDALKALSRAGYEAAVRVLDADTIMGS